jgi:hypothetical protein
MAEYQSLGMVSMEFKDWSIFFLILKNMEKWGKGCVVAKKIKERKERKKD